MECTKHLVQSGEALTSRTVFTAILFAQLSETRRSLCLFHGSFLPPIKYWILQINSRRVKMNLIPILLGRLKQLRAAVSGALASEYLGRKCGWNYSVCYSRDKSIFHFNICGTLIVEAHEFHNCFHCNHFFRRLSFLCSEKILFTGFVFEKM